MGYHRVDCFLHRGIVELLGGFVNKKIRQTTLLQCSIYKATAYLVDKRKAVEIILFKQIHNDDDQAA